MTWTVIKMLLSLFVVILIAVFILRWGLPRLGVGYQRSGFIQVVGRFPLEARKALYIVQVAKRYYLLGLSDHSVTYLTELPENEIAPMLVGHERSSKIPKSFIEVLRGRGSSKSNSESAGS